MIRHILLIKFKPAIGLNEIEDTQTLFVDIAQKVSGIEAVEWGVNDSPEQLNQGYTHTVLMTFADESARQQYLQHPAHEALKAIFVPRLDDIIVFDYQL
jgi:hypothetical protein